MFWFCKPKKLEINFYTTNETIFNCARPKHASQYIPSWFKELPKQVFKENTLIPTRTLRTCEGFRKLHASGFMFPLWSDLNLEIGESHYRYQFADLNSAIHSHSAIQHITSPFVNNYINIKLINPWHIQTNIQTDLLFTAPVWNEFGYDDILVMPGSFSPHTIPIGANINLFVKRQKTPKIYQLLFGQPLVHVIPLTNKQIKLKYHLITKEELNKMQSKSAAWLMFGNRFRRSLKECPMSK